MSYVRHHVPNNETSRTPVCIYLRSKAIYVTGDRQADHRDEDGSHFCWCNQTQREVGPDGLPVLRTECTPTRDCYRLTR